MKTEKKNNKKEKKESQLAAAPFTTSTRGRIFEGIVKKKFPTRIVIEMERILYVKKYERFYKKKSKIHARLPAGMDVNIGDLVQIQECRPLSKIIHAVMIKKLKSVESYKQGDKK
ncbi:30S ribosomal protein S17 [Candidatus Pacearchaeota archaeon]|nr:30S ribosomal protein S17 [Candidatus Pacearchaeota archaeon]